ncbi:MAG TPA: UDP-N-acetylglucosamine 1-carboxyvinyltransferase, partial [Candidatus Saccharimonadales bacterium]|nr:UDP-N-acetylglucosamine 1-carboxyvinyltransferase [Candidatus Saccharimonadales bacterium]
LLTDESCTIYDIPKIEDVTIIKTLLERIGAEVEESRPGTLRIQAGAIRNLTHQDLNDITGRSRIPITMSGPLLKRFAQAAIPKLGGCKIGPRPIDFHVKALHQLGADLVEDEDGEEWFKTATPLKGATIKLDYPSVGATIQVLFSSVLAEGITEIHNAAVEPEIMDLVAVLQKMGAIIEVDTDRVIRIEGVGRLGGFKHHPIPDRNEAVSWACAALATNGRIFIRNAQQSAMMTFLNKYRQMGGGFDSTDDGITFYRQNGALLPVNIATDVHPGFMTDWQQPLVVVLTQAGGVSKVGETVYESRFAYIEALRKMGAKITVHQGTMPEISHFKTRRAAFQTAEIHGSTPLRGATIEIPDLRAGFSYVIAALTAKGVSTLRNFSVLGRGYEQIIAKLQSLGVEIIEVRA